MAPIQQHSVAQGRLRTQAVQRETLSAPAAAVVSIGDKAKRLVLLRIILEARFQGLLLQQSISTNLAQPRSQPIFWQMPLASHRGSLV
jgi:hypothetical protein